MRNVTEPNIHEAKQRKKNNYCMIIIRIIDAINIPFFPAFNMYYFLLLITLVIKRTDRCKNIKKAGV